MAKNIFNFNDYRAYFRYKTEDAASVWGVKSKLAKAMGCQLPLVSQFLVGNAELSQEQVFKAATFFSLDDEESEFLLLLQQHNRAGTADLKNITMGKLKK